MKCLLTYKLSLSLFSPEITFENTNFSIISRETKTEIMCLSLSMSLRIFVNPGPGDFQNSQFKFCKAAAENTIRDARTPQPGEIVFNTMRYSSSETVQRLGHFQSSVSVQIMFT